MVSNWVVRAGEAKPDDLRKGYVQHQQRLDLWGFSVQYAPDKSIEDLARAGQFPNAQISYAEVDALAAALFPLHYSMRLEASPGRGHHHRLRCCTMPPERCSRISPPTRRWR